MLVFAVSKIFIVLFQNEIFIISNHDYPPAPKTHSHCSRVLWGFLIVSQLVSHERWELRILYPISVDWVMLKININIKTTSNAKSERSFQEISRCTEACWWRMINEKDYSKREKTHRASLLLDKLQYSIIWSVWAD